MQWSEAHRRSAHSPLLCQKVAGALDGLTCTCSNMAPGAPTPIIDTQIVLIHDLYPKAMRHALVIARDAALQGLTDLSQEHLPLLEHMQVCLHAWN